MNVLEHWLGSRRLRVAAAAVVAAGALGVALAPLLGPSVSDSVGSSELPSRR